MDELEVGDRLILRGLLLLVVLLEVAGVLGIVVGSELLVAVYRWGYAVLGSLLVVGWLVVVFRGLVEDIEEWRR